MDSINAAMAAPSYGFFATIFIGLLAGWIAERITSANHGLFTNILVGIAGSFLGTRAAELLDIPIRGFVGTLIAAIAGAVVVIAIWNAARR